MTNLLNYQLFTTFITYKPYKIAGPSLNTHKRTSYAYLQKSVNLIKKKFKKVVVYEIVVI